MQKYRKIKDIMSRYSFETDLKKNRAEKTKKSSRIEKNRKKQEKNKKLLQSYTPCLDSQSVKNNSMQR